MGQSAATTELPISVGKVNYLYSYEEEEKNEMPEEQTFSVEFQSLKELMVLLSPERASFYALARGVKRVAVDSVTFSAKSVDGATQVETLLMEDEMFVELMQK